MSAVVTPLRTALAAVLGVSGISVGVVVVTHSDAFVENEYLQIIARDTETTPAVKAAMVLGAYYESSFNVRLVPYVDRAGRGQPLTVCNGVTNVGMPRGFPPIDAGRTYTLHECYRIERALYTGYEASLPTYVVNYIDHTVWQQATYMDFIHHFGLGAFATSTMRKKANAGDAVGACLEHAKWKYTTLPNGAKTVLAGLKKRANSNAEVCGWDFEVYEQPQAQVVFGDGFGDAA